MSLGCRRSVSYVLPSSFLVLTTSEGGAVVDDCRYSLADISLRWMVKQVILSQCGILFDHTALRKADINIVNIVFRDPDQPSVGDFWKESQTSKSPSTEPSHHWSDDHPDEGGAAEPWPTDQDVLADSHDEFKARKVWWMLELFPMKYAWQEANGKWNAKWG